MVARTPFFMCLVRRNWEQPLVVAVWGWSLVWKYRARFPQIKGHVTKLILLKQELASALLNAFLLFQNSWGTIGCLCLLGWGLLRVVEVKASRESAASALLWSGSWRADINCYVCGPCYFLWLYLQSCVIRQSPNTNSIWKNPLYFEAWLSFSLPKLN